MEKPNNIILIILIFNLCFMFYLYLQIKHLKKEQFSSTSQEQLKQTIKDIYQADIGAIRTLSDIAGKLQAGGTITVPGDLTITGSLTTGSLKNSSFETGYLDTSKEGNAGKIVYGGSFDPAALCILGKGTDGTNRKVHIWDNLVVNRDTLIQNNLDIGTTTNTFYLNTQGTAKLNNLETEYIKVCATDANADGVSGTISNGKHDAASLCIIGKKVGENRTIHMWDDLLVNRNLYVANNINVPGDGFNSCMSYVTGAGGNILMSVPLTTGLYISTYSLSNDSNTTGSVWTYIMPDTRNGGSLNTALWNGRIGNIEWNIVNNNQVTAKYNYTGLASLRIVKICNF
jgi:hypothetical protein